MCDRRRPKSVSARHRDRQRGGHGGRRGCRSVLLTPKGHIVADMQLFVRRRDLDRRRCWPGACVAETLSRYAIMDDFAATPQADFPASLLGPKAAARLQAIGVDAPATRERAHADLEISEGSCGWRRVRELGGDGYWLGGPRGAAAMRRASGWPRRRRRSSNPPPPRRRASPRSNRASAPRSPPTTFRWRSVSTARSTTPRGVTWAGADRAHPRPRAHQLAPRAAGPGRPAGRRAGDLLETDAKPKAGRMTSAARLPDGRGSRWRWCTSACPSARRSASGTATSTSAAQVRAERAPASR